MEEEQLKNKENNDSDSSECVHTVLNRIQGLDDNFNDVIIFKSVNSSLKSVFNVIYFGGDIQDYPDEMKKSLTSRNFTQWNLINTGKLLFNKFNSSLKSNETVNIIIIRADYFHLKCFANYSNFLMCTDFGVPLSGEDLKISSKLNDQDDSSSLPCDKSDESIAKKLRCWHHLQKIYTNAIQKYNIELNSNEQIIDFELPIVLCGFSKGCVILNQLCNELENADFDSKQASQFDENEKEANNACILFSKQIRHLVWLDGGHSGTKNSWITREEIVLLIKNLKWSCYIYVTPYQIKSSKYWAIEEYNRFIDLLKNLNVNMKHVYYFEENEDDFDIEVHFEVLKKFDTLLI